MPSVNDAERGSKPLLPASSRFPLEQLSPESFEQFVTSVLGILGPRLPPADSFAAVQKSSGPTDDGFDLEARRCADQGLVCIQCKHLTSESLGLDMVARELTKVALHCADKRLGVVMHLFVTSAKKAKNLENALREPSRDKLLGEALRVLHGAKELEVRRQRVMDQGLSPEAVVERYIRSVQVWVWSGEQLFIECQAIWSQLTDVLERHFTLATVLREHPRPDFDEPRYLRRCVPSKEDPFVNRKGRSRSHLPVHIRSSSMADPLARESRQPSPAPGGGAAVRRPSLVKDLLETPQGHCTLVTGSGGAGKTTLLRRTLAEAARQRAEDPEEPLPILVELSHYRGDLGRLIDSELGLHHGRWDSLTGGFLLLCDGLNEVPPEQLGRLSRELQDVLSRLPVSLVLTVRSEGVRRPMVLPNIDRIFDLVPFGLLDVAELASAWLAPASRKVFLDAVRLKLDTEEVRMLELPFGLATALRLFRETGALPRTESELYDRVLEQRFRRDQELHPGLLPEPLPDIPHTTVRALAEALADALRFVRQESTLKREELGVLLTQILSRLREAGMPGIEELSSLKAQQLLQHYELLSISDEWARFPHDLLLDFLASRALARNWREKTGFLQSSTCDEAWVLASPLIPAHDRAEFLHAIAQADIALAARCGRAMGEEGILLAQGELLRQLRGKDSLYTLIQVCTAMAVLRTDLCLAMLRALAQDEDALRSAQAQQSLIEAGEEQVLEGVLEVAEIVTGTQDVPSGEALERWEAALPSAALRVARRRLDASGAQGIVRIAIRTLGWYGDESDVPAVEKVLGATRDPLTVRMAFRILYWLSSRSALQRVEELLSRHPPGTQFLVRGVLAQETGEADVEWMVGFVLSHPVALAHAPGNDLSVRDICGLQRRAIRQLQLLKDGLPPEARQRCVTALRSAGQDSMRFRLWLLAPLLPPEAVAPHLQEAIPTCGLDELGVIAGVIHQMPATAPERAALLGLLQQRLDQEPGASLDRGTQQALAVCMFQEDRETRATGIAFQLMRVLSESEPDSREAGRELLNRLLVLAVPLRELLPPELIGALMDIDVTGLTEKDRRMLGHLLLHAPDAELDARLENIPGLTVRLCFMSLLGKRKLSPRRRSLLKRDFAAALSDSEVVIHLHALLLEQWDESLARLLVEEVTNARWEPDYLPEVLFDGIGERFDRALAETVIAPVLDRHMHVNAWELLRYWYDFATQSRP